MAHTYLLFDFGTDEEKAQLARQKLERWKQAFRLDKKLQYKLERPEDEDKAAPEHAHEAAETPKAEKPKAKSKAKHKSKETEASEEDPAANGKVNLLVRLYFSGHEKLTEQRWLDRIPSEEPFKEASPRVIRHGEDLVAMLIQQQMIIAEMAAAHVPMEVFRLHVQPEYIRQQEAQFLADLVDAVMLQVGGCF